MVPRNPLTGIEINDESVCSFNVINSRVPRMKLYRAHRNQAKKSVQVINPNPNSLSAFTLLDAQLMNRSRHFRQLATMIEGHAMRMPHKLERSSAEMNERALCDCLPICNQLLFGWRHSIR